MAVAVDGGVGQLDVGVLHTGMREIRSRSVSPTNPVDMGLAQNACIDRSTAASKMSASTKTRSHLSRIT
jgi:hypothetical protein